MLMPAIFGKLRKEVKRRPWKTSECFATLRAVAKRRDTFASLLERLLPAEEGWEGFAKRSGVSSRTVRLLRDKGAARPYRATVAKLAKALGVDPATVRAAISASRAAKE